MLETDRVQNNVALFTVCRLFFYLLDRIRAQPSETVDGLGSGLAYPPQKTCDELDSFIQSSDKNTNTFRSNQVVIVFIVVHPIHTQGQGTKL